MGCITVVGSINLDIVTLVDRLPARGETVIGRAGPRGLGGKGANQAIAALRAGGAVRLVGAVGRDLAGAEMRVALRDYSLETGAVESVDAPTGHAYILVGDGDNQIAVTLGANRELAASSIAALDFHPGDICLAQLEVSAAIVAQAFGRARAGGALTILNVAPADADSVALLLPLADVIVANESEWSLILRRPFSAEEAASTLTIAAASPAMSGKMLLVATLGVQGVCAVTDGRAVRLAARAANAVDATGAGDCFCGYLAAALAVGASVEDALSLANAAATLSVSRPGAAASMPWRAEVDESLARQGASL